MDHTITDYFFIITSWLMAHGRMPVGAGPLTSALMPCRGVALEGLGRFEEAIADYRAVLAVAPDDPAGWNNLGNASNGLGRWGWLLLSRPVSCAGVHSAIGELVCCRPHQDKHANAWLNGTLCLHNTPCLIQ
jgi:hypothetical protein